MTAMSNAFLRAMGVPETKISNSAPFTPSEKEDNAALEEPEDMFVKITNKHGHPELGFYEKDHWFPVCTSCHCHKMPNLGGGTACEQCQNDALAEMAHDYY